MFSFNTASKEVENNSSYPLLENKSRNLSMVYLGLSNFWGALWGCADVRSDSLLDASILKRQEYLGLLKKQCELQVEINLLRKEWIYNMEKQRLLNINSIREALNNKRYELSQLSPTAYVDSSSINENELIQLIEGQEQILENLINEAETWGVYSAELIRRQDKQIIAQENELIQLGL